MVRACAPRRMGQAWRKAVISPGKRLAKLFFNYAAMAAGKSTSLLQASYNYNERRMETLLLVSAVDDRTRRGEIASRILGSKQ